jgi:hypothetical protein
LSACSALIRSLLTSKIRRDLDRRTVTYWDYENPERDEDGSVIDGARVEKVFDTVAERDAFMAKHYAEAKREAEKAERKAEATSGNVVTFPGHAEG